MEFRKSRGHSETRPKRILVVDDSSPVLNSIKFMLESVPDWIVDGEAHDGREAIEKLARVLSRNALIDLFLGYLEVLRKRK
jgi:CheY-like chemotaxis protein